MRQRIASLLFLLLAANAEAADAGRWAQTPEAYFMTREERSDWATLKTGEEQERFIGEFRARHSPDFVAEVQRRAAIVDERMPLGDTKASLTTRGKIVILLGAPAQLTVRFFPRPAPGNVGHPLETRKGGATEQTKMTPTLIGGVGGWVEYTLHYGPNPALQIGPEGWTVVVEADSISGHDRLKIGQRQRKKLESILDAAARSSLRVP